MTDMFDTEETGLFSVSPDATLDLEKMIAEHQQAQAEEKARLIWGCVGEQKSGRSQTFSKIGFMNLEYKDQEWFPDSLKKMLKQGLIPEVERLLILDTEGAWKRKLLKVPITKRIFKPLIDKKSLVVIPVIVKDKITKRLDEEATRHNLESIIYTVAEQASEGTALMIDNMSDYAKWLEYELKKMHGKTVIKTMKAGSDPEQALLRPFWAWRSGEWDKTMKNLADIFGHVVCTFRANRKWITIPGEYQGPSSDPEDIYPVWDKGTESWLDECVWFIGDVVENQPQVQFEFKFTNKQNGGTYPPTVHKGILRNDRGSFMQLYDLISHNFLL